MIFFFYFFNNLRFFGENIINNLGTYSIRHIGYFTDTTDSIFSDT